MKVGKEDVTMRSVSRSKKKFLFLFVCGFFIGIYLEVFLVEKNQTSSSLQGELLKQKVGVVCLILLKHNHERYVNISRKTWLKHCDNFYIVNIQRQPKTAKESRNSTSVHSGQHSFLDNSKNSAAEVSISSQTYNITAKSAWSGLCKALLLSTLNDNEWLIVVPDNVMVLLENLKRFIKNFNSEHFYYFGYAIENYEANYNALSAGILVSQGTLKKLFSNKKSESDCDGSGKFWGNEDIFLGKYLKEIGILPEDTRDEEGRGRFHGYNVNNLLWPGRLFTKSNYIKKALFPVQKGFKCCSPFLITLPVSDPDAMYKQYYFFYKVKTAHDKIPPQKQAKPMENFFWKDFLREEGYSENEIEHMTSEEYFRIWEKKLPPEVAYQEMRDFMKQQRQHISD